MYILDKFQMNQIFKCKGYNDKNVLQENMDWFLKIILETCEEVLLAN